MKIDRLFLLIFILVILFTACDKKIDPPESKTESWIVNKWQFLDLNMNGVWPTQHFGWGFEPIEGISYIRWYWFTYNSDHTYEFRSDVYANVLGYGENYQPIYGYWEFDEKDSLLIHNKGMPYEKTYRIRLISWDKYDTILVRFYDRIIYQSSDTALWQIGDTVTYREALTIRKGPCCPNPE